MYVGGDSGLLPWTALVIMAVLTSVERWGMCVVARPMILEHIVVTLRILFLFL